MSERLTIEDVRERVHAIRDLAPDGEAAHSAEDQLHQLVLSAIADDCCADPVGCAKAALETLQIAFPRWYA